MAVSVQIAIAVTLLLRLALIPLELYRSTDFEVHRNWLAITHSLPLSRWYYEETSPWTLDYPPFFAAFEWVLSQAAAFTDPEMLRVSNLEYASLATVVFQRCSVVAGDLLLVLGARRLGSTLGSSAQGWSTALLALVGPGLLIVDHVHFQYNGMLFGVLLFSVADLEAGHIYRGAALFAALLNMKQIFLYLAPVYFVFLLRGHCACVFGVGPLGVRLNFGNLVRLGLTVLAVLALALLPILATGQGMQMVSRLFPFGRGLTHAYWAPNVWALYNTADRVLAKLGLGAHQGASSTAGFAEVYESSVLWTVPPKATFALTLLAYAPLARLIWRQTAPSPSLPLPPASSGADAAAKPREFAAMPEAGRGRFALYAALGSAISFACGWHVHEKAILMVTVPLIAAVSAVGGPEGGVGDELRQAAAALSVIGTFSVLPLLPQRPLETALKWSVGVAGHCVELYLLRRRPPAGGSGDRRVVLGMLGVWPLPGWMVLLGVAVLGAYTDLGGHKMIFKGRMEFLPLLLISDFSAVLVMASFIRLFRLTSRLTGPGTS